MLATHKLMGAGGVTSDFFEFVTSNSSTFTEGQTTHTFPSGIQAGDLLVMLQSNAMETTDGYGPSANTGLAFGTGFTEATDVVGGGYQNFYKPTTQYSVGNFTVSYKVAAGTESNASIGGFEVGTNTFGTPYGTRHVFVFRPSFSHSNTVSVTRAVYRTSIGTATAASHTASASITPSASLPSCGVVFFASSGVSKTASLSGGVTSFDNTSSASSGSYIARSVFRGAFTCKKGTSQITASGPSSSTDADGVFLFSFTLS
jgi:hypothetical protein